MCVLANAIPDNGLIEKEFEKQTMKLEWKKGQVIRGGYCRTYYLESTFKRALHVSWAGPVN